MSSYVESAYSIERRRLLEILNQCQKELDDAICAIASKKSERERGKKLFQENMKMGLQEQSESRLAEKMHENLEHIELLSECDYLEKQYAEIMNKSVKRQLSEIREHLLKKDIQAVLLSAMIKRLEEQLEKKLQIISVGLEDNLSRNITTVKPVSKGRKGVMIGGTSKKERKILTNHEVAEEFEYKLQMAKKITSSNNDRVFEVERNYLAQPDFAKELYAQKMVLWINNILQEEQEKAQKADDDAAKISTLAKRYEALVSLLGNDEGEHFSVLGKDLLGSSYKALEIRCNELEKILIEKKKREYVTLAIRLVMKKHGIVYCGIDEKETKIYTYQYDENVDFSISGFSQNRFVAEMNGKYFGKVPTLDERRKSSSSAKKACDFLKKIREELAEEFGIIFEDVDVIEPSEKTINMISDRGNTSGSTAFYEIEKRGNEIW